MFKVVVVDDEIYVVALIQKLIDWDKFQMKVVGTANDGKTALELVKELEPDMVIVDVRMPGYDGIVFMDKIREFNTNIRFIVISGHKQFDYVRGAMRNSVEDYLLKPINKEELETVIENVCKKLIAAQNKESELKELEEKLDVSKRTIRETFINTLLKEEYKELDFELDQLNEKYLTCFQPGYYQMAALILETSDSLGGLKEYDLMLKEAHKNLFYNLKEQCIEVLDKGTESNIIIFFYNYNEENKNAVAEVVKNQFSKCIKQTKKFENLSFCICLGKACTQLSEVYSTVRSLQRSIFARTAMNSTKIVESGDIRESRDVLPSILEFGDKKLSQALAELNTNEISHCIKEMFSRAFYVVEEDSMLYYNLYAQLAEKIYQYFNDIGILTEAKTEFEQRLIRKYIQASNYREYARILSREMEDIIEENHLSDRDYATPTIRIIKRYIAEHYSEDISLTQVAQLVNLSPIYLSRLFKKEEGINFLDYLSQYRINVAKKLLQDMKYNMIEITDLSGFRNTKYFSKIFKKIVGITPSEYRKRYFNRHNFADGEG